MYSIFVGNPYECFEDNDTICATTNGLTRRNGKAVMGRGNAKFMRDTFHVDEKLGKYLKLYGNRAFYLGNYDYKNKKLNLATFPTKNHWRDKSDLNLISKSVHQIKQIADKFQLPKIYIPIPGCGNGQLKWSQVKPLLLSLDNRFIIYSLDEKDFDF